MTREVTRQRMSAGAFCALIALLCALAIAPRAEARGHHGAHTASVKVDDHGNDARDQRIAAGQQSSAPKPLEIRLAASQALRKLPPVSVCPRTADREHCDACPDKAIAALPSQRRQAAVVDGETPGGTAMSHPGTAATEPRYVDERKPPTGLWASGKHSRKHRRTALFARFRI